MSVAEEIERAVHERGPLTFAEFMELALYGPGGYYEAPPIGTSGDFVTSPHVHQVFGELLAAGLRELWVSLGRPDPFRVIEIGAGDGKLATQVREGIGDVPLDYAAVEVSGGARERLESAGVRAVTSLAELDPIDGGFVLANELLDNMPFRLVRGGSEGPVEVRVGWSDGRPQEVEHPCDDELSPFATAAVLEVGEEATVPVGALAFLDDLARSLARGFALLVDYGGPSSRTAGAVHGYREHRVVEDVLAAAPGSTDITAGVDFGAIVERARAIGLTPRGPVSQRAALLALGFERWASRERERQTKMLEVGAGLEAVRAWGGRSQASLLVDPAGLGRLRWLGLATPGLEWPSWMRSAQADDHDWHEIPDT